MTSTVLDLRNLGAISVTEFEDAAENTLMLTPLGQMLAATMFASLTPPPGEMAGVVVHRLGRLTPRIAEKIMDPWLAARTTADAAREVLDFAAYARADLRMVATAYVRTLGPDALPAWREQVKDRGVGVYARTWLLEQGEKVPVDGRDLDWMHVEKLSAHMAAMPEPIRETLLADLGAHHPDALPELRRVLSRSRHPDAPRLMDTLAVVTGQPAAIARYDSPPAPSTANSKAYRLRISLRYVEEPDVWRLVGLDADTTLADLHEIIQAAMGWSDEHAHGFSVGRAGIDEAAPLSRVFRKPGDRLLYTYDFGDSWEHDVVFEDYLQNDSGDTLPFLLGGSGACPPEDCGGAPGYQRLKEIMADPGHEEHAEMDSSHFSLAKAAAAVSCLHPRRPLTVARVQVKRKKRRR